MVKNLPASAADTGSSPGPGRSHMLRGMPKKVFLNCYSTSATHLYPITAFTYPTPRTQDCQNGECKEGQNRVSDSSSKIP